MKKIFVVIMTSLLAISLIGCSAQKTYKISIREGDEENIVSCPKKAKAGDVVTVETVTVCDADLYLNVDGVAEVKQVGDGVFTFVMPDHEVTVKVTIISNGLA